MCESRLFVIGMGKGFHKQANLELLVIFNKLLGVFLYDFE